jgi:photoactive yellow protein
MTIMAKHFPDYYDAKLAEKVEALNIDDVNALPFGAIRLDAEGTVTFYSEAERRLSGSGTNPRLGHNFFHEIAPCMDHPDYRGRIDQAKARGTLDLEFTHIGDFEDRERELTVRVQSASAGGYWIFMKRD